ncbi:MAG: pilus assembly protein PilM, partial [Planctomycetaceae bacterium]|nr:pilus assembly protein PilM [Planctomycetaceae bacterium]
MARVKAVWGIDIGQCALKALRCRRDGSEVVAEAFDYIEYPKILSQPEAEPEKLIQESLEKFLSRNDVKETHIALAVPGQSGLAKFFKPPPVPTKQIPEIVKYEARQQIPFDLEDVIWDFQQMRGGTMHEGIAMDTEVGLFAMKRDQVYRALRPMRRCGLELDTLQLAPISIYNFVIYDLLQERLYDELDPDDPPDSLVVLSLGTETTDLVITNGFRLWQRSIPVGGSHFTKQLTKDMKLTFAKAEHLKRNARKAEDPKQVFQAMRPVFNDMVTEVQRSISYFLGIDRQAKINGVLLLGNTVKLPGLTQYLAKNLGYDVIPFDGYTRLNGQEVVNSSAFRDNYLSFGASYGLCLQALGQADLKTNLIPKEMVTERLVRAKKPWALASVASLLLACSFSFFSAYSDWNGVRKEKNIGGVTWGEAENQVKQAQSQSSAKMGEHDAKKNNLDKLKAIGNQLVSNGERRLLWMEMLTALNNNIPVHPVDAQTPHSVFLDPEKIPFDKRQDIQIRYIESKYYEKLADWFTDDVAQLYTKNKSELQRLYPAVYATRFPEEVKEAAKGKNSKKKAVKPDGDGWVIEMEGFHFYNTLEDGKGHLSEEFVQRTLMRNLFFGKVQLPDGNYSLQEIGITYPVMVKNGEVEWEHMESTTGSNSGLAGGGGMGGGMG